MKGLLSIGLLLCLIVPFLGAWQFLSNKVLKIKEQVSIRISEGSYEEQKVLFKFTEAESQTQLKWEHSGEFEYKGEMYDILCSEVRGDTTWYWCFWDKAETGLKNELRNIIAIALGKNPENQSRQNHITNYFKNLIPFTHPFCPKEFCPDFVLGTTEYFFSSSTFIPSPPFPPPELS